MGSLGQTTNVLEYVRSRTRVDCDSQDIQFATSWAPFVDCTSNQADAYFELLKPQRAALLKKSAALGRELHSAFPDVQYEELSVEIAMIGVVLTIAPLITGTIHVMANPTNAYSTAKVVKNGKRIADLCRRMEPGFDMSRLCIKVPATWEGLQACRALKNMGIRTLATTLFSMEQAILAGEVGCAYISPFVHELKCQFDETYHDTDSILDVCVKAQRYYEQHSYDTKVKAASLLTTEEVVQLAGVASITIPPPILEDLSKLEEPVARLAERSLFVDEPEDKDSMERVSFVDDEEKFRTAFSKRGNGKAESNTVQAIELFSEFQVKAEALMRDTDLTRIG